MQTKHSEALRKFLEFSSPKEARKVIIKLYFNVDKKLISEKDHEEVFLLYNLFEDCENEKSPD